MQVKATPYPLDGDCPCGSGLIYRQCCASKQFEFGIDDAGNLVRSVPLSDETIEVIDEAAGSFEELYGRKPAKDDLLFGHLVDPTDSVHASARALISSGVDPAKVFAYVRTDGLLPTEINVDNISDFDLGLFEEFVDKFRTPEIVGEDHAPSFVFVLLGNDLISESVAVARSRMRRVLVDFLSRHMSAQQRQARMEPSFTRKADFSVRSPLDYALFSALKTKRTLDSLELLSAGEDPASIYSIARSVFENTVYLDSISEDPSVFWDGISPKTDSVNYEFGRYRDGRINFNHVVHRQTGERARTNMRFSDLAQSPKRSMATRDLYSLFYVTASQYVHVDVLSARGYFYDADPFDELDETLLASLLAVVLVGDLLRALRRSEGVNEAYARDVRSFLDSMADELDEALVCANGDPEHANAVFDVLRTLVAGWRISSTHSEG